MIVIFVLIFALLGLLLGYAASNDKSVIANPVMLTLSTDKLEYESLETVVFTARNGGGERLVFPNTALGIRIVNIDTGTGYGVVAGEAETPLGVGETKQIIWSEGGEGGEPGNYIASIRTVTSSPSAMAEAQFKIRG